jgi:hypothetical protein
MSNQTKRVFTDLMLAAAATFALTGAGCATTGSATGAVAQAETVEDVCSGVPAKQQELGLLAYRESLGPATPVRQLVPVSKGVNVSEERGVQIPVRAQPGLTAAWVGRVATCHAGLASAGKLGAGSPDDPLLVPGVKIAVAETATGYLVTVEAPSSSAASDLMRRSYAMNAGAATSMTAQK